MITAVTCHNIHREPKNCTCTLIFAMSVDILGRLTLDPAGMHCPSWDDAFVSSDVCV